MRLAETVSGDDWAAGAGEDLADGTLRADYDWHTLTRLRAVATFGMGVGAGTRVCDYGIAGRA